MRELSKGKIPCPKGGTRQVCRVEMHVCFLEKVSILRRLCEEQQVGGAEVGEGGVEQRMGEGTRVNLSSARKILQLRISVSFILAFT